MPKAKKSALSLPTVEVRFPDPDPTLAFAPVEEAISADGGFGYYIFGAGKNPTETGPGVLRCSVHANRCLVQLCAGAVWSV